MKNDLTEAAELLERLSRVLHNDASATEGLNPVQWAALRYFARANRFSASPSALTAFLGVTKGTVSQTINAIERKGLVKKAPVAGDARAVNITMTAKGRRLLEKDPLGGLHNDLDSFETQDLAQLNELLKRLVGNALDRKQGAAFGVCKTCRHFNSTHTEGDPHWCGLLEVPLGVDEASMICREQDSTR